MYHTISNILTPMQGILLPHLPSISWTVCSPAARSCATHIANLSQVVDAIQQVPSSELSPDHLHAEMSPPLEGPSPAPAHLLLSHSSTVFTGIVEGRVLLSKASILLFMALLLPLLSSPGSLGDSYGERT